MKSSKTSKSYNEENDSDSGNQNEIDSQKTKNLDGSSANVD